jgi:Domain of unknown function (DUF3806)
MQRIEELNDAERQWIASCIDAARQMVTAFSPNDSGKPIDASILDRAYAGWLATNESDGNRINEVINAIGFAFGQLLVTESGFRFVVATDDQGCEMAILALPGKGDVLVYPSHLVDKRWRTRETGFLVPLHRVITDQVRDVAANWPNLPDAFGKK